MKFKHLLCVMLSLILILGCTACSGSDDKLSTPAESGTSGEADDGDSNAFGTVGGADEEESSSDIDDPTSSGETDEPSQDDTEAETPDDTEAPDDNTETTEERFVYTFEERNDTVYTTANLNIRRGPYNDAEIVDVAPAGTKLNRVGYNEFWCMVKYNGETLYASTAYLTETAPTTAETPSQNQGSVSNRSINFGYVRNQRDDKNVPKAMYEYVNNWGDRADFLQDTTKKVVYLTMDEGYEAGNTPAILDTLKEKNVTAVFFVTKQFVDECPQLVQRMIDEGHIIGNHTCSHPAAGMPSLSVEDQKADIMKLHNMVLDQFGYEMKLFRYPAGIYSDQSLDVVSSLGYRSVFWSFAYRDFDLSNQPDPTEALNMCLNELHPGAIYLLHAVSSTNTQILGDWIDAVRAQGYEFGVYPVN